MKPKVSVIIPVYNVEKYLRQCLDSVINQTLRDIQIILVDNGSTDKSLQILNEYAVNDNRITVIHQENSNAGHARNTGLNIATGEYLSFLDSDDWFELNMLEEMYAHACQRNADLVTCNYRIYNEITQTIRNNHFPYREYYFMETDYCKTEDISKSVFQLLGIVAWDKLFSTAMVKENNIRFLEITTNNDIFFVLKSIICSKRIGVLHTYLITYRNNHGKSIQQTNTMLTKCNNIVLTYKKFLLLLEQEKFMCYKNSFKLRIYTTLIADLKKTPPAAQYDFCNIINKESVFKDTAFSNYLIYKIFYRLFYCSTSYTYFLFSKQILLNTVITKIANAQTSIKIFGIKPLIKNIQKKICDKIKQYLF